MLTLKSIGGHGNTFRRPGVVKVAIDQAAATGTGQLGRVEVGVIASRLPDEMDHQVALGVHQLVLVFVILGASLAPAAERPAVRVLGVALVQLQEPGADQPGVALGRIDAHCPLTVTGLRC